MSPHDAMVDASTPLQRRGAWLELSADAVATEARGINTRGDIVGDYIAYQVQNTLAP